jgi:DNA-binding LacI/PurR family transcriptional regulator
MERDPRKVTSFDVARLAGVSRAAVSRAFTQDASVSPQMRAKVHEAAKQLGYRVNYLARSLNGNRSDLVGVVAAGLDNPFRSLQIEAISRALLARNFRPILLPTSSAADVSDVVSQVLHYSVSGVIITSDAPPTELCQECAARGVPIVLINKGDELPLVDRLISDDATAGQLAATRLVAGGARRPAVMAAVEVSYTARRRKAAFLQSCADLGVEARYLPVPRNDYASGHAAAADLAAWGIDGLFCINDYLACGVIDRMARDRQTALRIIGHDDIPQASWGAYDLTTIAQPVEPQAMQAIDLLVSRMADPAQPARTEATAVSLVQRSSG